MPETTHSYPHPHITSCPHTEDEHLDNGIAFSPLSPTGDPSICSISNPDFVIYSSVVSFYVPFGVTVLVYARIYMVLRQRRRKRILTRQNSQCISIRPGFPQQVSAWQELADSTPAPSFQSRAHPCRWGQDQHTGGRFTSPSTQLALSVLDG